MFTVCVRMVCVACAVENTKEYSKRCEVSSCDAGWKVSADKAKCEANQCKCLNGVGASEAKCPTHGASKCESCNTGFNLASDAKSCAGTVWRSSLIVLLTTWVCVERMCCLTIVDDCHASH